jgi:hypothetical protein
MNSTRDKRSLQEKLDYELRKFMIYYEFIMNSPYKSDSYHWYKEAMGKAYREKDLKGLRETNADIKSTLKERYSEPVRIKVLRLWHEELGEDSPEKLEVKTKAHIDRIIAKGKISTLTEYRFAFEWVENNYNEPSVDQEKLMKINILLADYHKKWDEKRKAHD